MEGVSNTPLSKYNYRFEICCYFTMANFTLNFPNIELLSSYSFQGALQLLLPLNPCHVIAFNT